MKALDLWLPCYLARRPARTTAPRHALIAVCDHFEPFHQNKGDSETALAKLRHWADAYPRLRDEAVALGLPPPVHTCFYPIEQYDPRQAEFLAAFQRAGWAETEVHLHHGEDTAETLRALLERGVGQLAGHGLLSAESPGGAPRFGFIHGNWALAHSHPHGRHCGVPNELGLLRACGCYADFTMPSAPDRCQTRVVNSIYWARDHGRPKPHDHGRPACVGAPPPAPEELLLIQGPLALDWRRRKMGVLPSLENGDLTAGYPPTLARFQCWLRQAIQVTGRPEWVFIKLHTHGCKPANLPALLGEPMRRFLRELGDWAKRHPEVRIHFVSARQMANLVLAAEAGADGDPSLHFDFRYWLRA